MYKWIEVAHNKLDSNKSLHTCKEAGTNFVIGIKRYKGYYEL